MDEKRDYRKEYGERKEKYFEKHPERKAHVTPTPAAPSPDKTGKIFVAEDPSGKPIQVTMPERGIKLTGREAEEAAKVILTPGAKPKIAVGEEHIRITAETEPETTITRQVSPAGAPPPKIELPPEQAMPFYREPIHFRYGDPPMTTTSEMFVYDTPDTIGRFEHGIKEIFTVAPTYTITKTGFKGISETTTYSVSYPKDKVIQQLVAGGIIGVVLFVPKLGKTAVQLAGDPVGTVASIPSGIAYQLKHEPAYFVGELIGQAAFGFGISKLRAPKPHVSIGIQEAAIRAKVSVGEYAGIGKVAYTTFVGKKVIGAKGFLAQDIYKIPTGYYATGKALIQTIGKKAKAPTHYGVDLTTISMPIKRGAVSYSIGKISKLIKKAKPRKEIYPGYQLYTGKPFIEKPVGVSGSVTYTTRIATITKPESRIFFTESLGASVFKKKVGISLGKGKVEVFKRPTFMEEGVGSVYKTIKLKHPKKPPVDTVIAGVQETIEHMADVTKPMVKKAITAETPYRFTGLPVLRLFEKRAQKIESAVPVSKTTFPQATDGWGRIENRFGQAVLEKTKATPKRILKEVTIKKPAIKGKPITKAYLPIKIKTDVSAKFKPKTYTEYKYQQQQQQTQRQATRQITKQATKYAQPSFVPSVSLFVPPPTILPPFDIPRRRRFKKTYTPRPSRQRIRLPKFRFGNIKKFVIELPKEQKHPGILKLKKTRAWPWTGGAAGTGVKRRKIKEFGWTI